MTLPAPTGVRATAGRGHVTVDWQRVDGAAGYLVHRADRPEKVLVALLGDDLLVLGCALLGVSFVYTRRRARRGDDEESS